MKNTKKTILVLVALFLCFYDALQASSNALSNAEYRNTRRLFAALGLKHTNTLVMEESEKELIKANEAETNEYIQGEIRDVISTGHLSISQITAIQGIIKRQPIRKDLQVKFINKRIGYGVFATNAMLVNTVIGVYSGEIRTTEDVNQDYAFPFPGINSLAMFSDDEDEQNSCYWVDATTYGNATRFINHSSNQNCNTFSILDGNKIPQTVFITRDPIKKGEQLTINYGDVYNWDKKSVTPEVIISK